MFAADKALVPLSRIQLSAEEKKILGWLREAAWEKVVEAREPTARAKVPEFFGGVRLYRIQASGGAAGSQNPLELFIKKLGFQGVIGKQEMYPLVVEGGARFVVLKQAELDNLGVGTQEDDE